MELVGFSRIPQLTYATGRFWCTCTLTPAFLSVPSPTLVVRADFNTSCNFSCEITSLNTLSRSRERARGAKRHAGEGPLRKNSEYAFANCAPSQCERMNARSTDFFTRSLTRASRRPPPSSGEAHFSIKRDLSGRPRIGVSFRREQEENRKEGAAPVIAAENISAFRGLVRAPEETKMRVDRVWRAPFYTLLHAPHRVTTACFPATPPTPADSAPSLPSRYIDR